MRKEEKNRIKNDTERLIFVAIAALIQIIFVVFIFTKLYEKYIFIDIFIRLVGLGIILFIYNKNENAMAKMPWVILIYTIPFFGVAMYLMYGNKNATKKMREKFENSISRSSKYLKSSAKELEILRSKSGSVYGQSYYIENTAGYPVYQNTDVEFFAEAKDGFESQLEELKKAEKFIFMEYHAIEEASSFERLADILEDRVKAGVDVRLIYDDMGSIGFLDKSFLKRVRARGINCRIFNPVSPFINIFMNNRDHRKITVVDGKVGYTGGYNLADEYFNITHPFGYWKDTGIKLRGEAVKSLTAIFLEMWNAMEDNNENLDKFFPEVEYEAKEDGFIQIYADNPIDDEYVSENIYLNMIKQAKDSLYIATPYLIISDIMIRELTLASRRGVDVRIITPGIPDKKFIYKITRSYYKVLIDAGVRVYEYTPGFLHQKQVVADSEVAIVGTINFDYRSLYHHFENAALLYGYKAVNDMQKDFTDMFSVSEEVTEKYKNIKTNLKIRQCIYRLLAPLL